VTLQAQGWYRDPYAIHEDRYISEGMPTKLVRDGGQEAYDPPPDRPMPQTGLIPARPAGDDPADGSDLHRADEACSEPAYDSGRALDAVVTIFNESVGPL
jgi:hypothetical protein